MNILALIEISKPFLFPNHKTIANPKTPNDTNVKFGVFYVYNSQISYINVGKYTKNTDILQNLTQKFAYTKNK